MTNRFITAGEIKNWFYCPRVVFYRRFTPEASKATFKMNEGVRAQEVIERLETRRNLSAYGVESYQREFGLWLTAKTLGLSGKLDVVLKGEHEAIPIDFKLTSGEPGENHRMQLAAYAALLEEDLGYNVERGLLYRIPDDRVYRIELGAEAKNGVKCAITQIRAMEEQEMLPEATQVRSRCKDCEYANFCADVW